MEVNGTDSGSCRIVIVCIIGAESPVSVPGVLVLYNTIYKYNYIFVHSGRAV
jgi:hypothetical protein